MTESSIEPVSREQDQESPRAPRGGPPLHIFYILAIFLLVVGVITTVFILFGWVYGLATAGGILVFYKFIWVIPTSRKTLRESELRLLATLSTEISYEVIDVDVSDPSGSPKPCRVHSIRFRRTDPIASGFPQREKVPLVLIHGLGAGWGMFIKNIPGLLEKYEEVWCVDLIGFAGSTWKPFAWSWFCCTRPTPRSPPSRTGSRADTVMATWAAGIHNWRLAVFPEESVYEKKIDLLGHSLGGYVVTYYSLVYPGTVRKLTLAGPVGIVQLQQLREWPRSIQLFVYAVYLTGLTRTKMVKVLGPFAPGFVRKTLERRKEWYGFKEKELVEYVVQLQCADVSGEDAFLKVIHPQKGFREHLLPDIPSLDVGSLTIILGRYDFIDIPLTSAIEHHAKVPTRLFIMEAGHHMYSNHPNEFNDYVH